MAKANLTGENVVLLTGYQKSGITQLGKDASNCAVLDSTCGLTICGKNWLRNYFGSLEEEDRKKITHNRTKRFGGGREAEIIGEYKLTIRIVEKDIHIKTDEVELDIPLMFSWSSMKKAGVKKDLENDIAIIIGKEVALNMTSSGHYCIPIDKTETVQTIEVNAVKLDEMNIKELKSTMFKLHCQFEPPPQKKNNWLHC